MKSLSDEQLNIIAKESLQREKIKKIELERYYSLDQSNQMLNTVVEDLYRIACLSGWCTFLCSTCILRVAYPTMLFMNSPWDSVGFHYRTDKKKIRLIRGLKHRARWPSFFSQKYKGFLKFIKGKHFQRVFSIFLFFNNFIAKIEWTGVIAEVQTVI